MQIPLVEFSCSVVFNTLWHHGLQHARLPCPSSTPRAHSDSRPSSQWYHPTVSSSVVPFSYCFQSFWASESFQMSQFFTSGGQSIRVSALASVLPMNVQDWLLQDWLVESRCSTRDSKSLQHLISKASILQHSAFFTVQLSHPYMTTGKTIALTRRTFLAFSMIQQMLATWSLVPLPFRKPAWTSGSSLFAYC